MYMYMNACVVRTLNVTLSQCSTERLTTASEVLQAARGKLAPQVEQALDRAAGKGEGDREREEKEVGDSSPDDIPPAVVDPALKGVSAALLEKVCKFVSLVALLQSLLPP